MNTFHVVAVKDDNKAHLVMRRRGQSPRGLAFTIWRALTDIDDRDGALDARQAAAAVKWVKGKGWKPRLVKHGFPFLMKDEGVVFPGDRALLVKLNRIGRELKRIVFVKSGYRNHYEQWVLRMRYLRGEGNLAARSHTATVTGGISGARYMLVHGVGTGTGSTGGDVYFFYWATACPD